MSKYLMGPTCDAECKGKILEVMVSHYDESQGDYDAAVKALLESPHAQSGNAVSRLHARLLWCQVDPTDYVPLRDHEPGRPLRRFSATYARLRLTGDSLIVCHFAVPPLFPPLARDFGGVTSLRIEPKITSSTT